MTVAAAIPLPVPEPPVARQGKCPLCGSQIPIYDRYSPWCECGWGLTPPARDEQPTLLESLYERAGKHFGTGLFEELFRSETLRPKLTLSKLLAYGVATIVHALTLSFVVVGVAIVLRFGLNFFTGAAALLCFYLAWSFLPEIEAPERPIIGRDYIPSLYRLVDRLGAHFHAEPLHGIILTEEFNAALGAVGWRRRPVLYIGLPLWAALEDDERLAVLAHEVAHQVNGDPSYGVYIGTAIYALTQWATSLCPARIVNPRYGLMGLLAIPLMLALRVLAHGLSWLALLTVWLLYRDEQRAEYLADALSAQVAGTDAALRSFQKQYLEHVVLLVVQRMVLKRLDKEDLFAQIRAAIRATPAREAERVHRLSQQESSRLGATHPPTAKRIAMLEAHPVTEPTLAVTADEWTNIDQEMHAIQPAYQQLLLGR